MSVLSFIEQKVLDVVSEAASRGATMPTNRQIAQTVGGSLSMPSHWMKKLETLGYVTVERSSTSRRVTVVATGASTADTPYGTKSLGLSASPAEPTQLQAAVLAFLTKAADRAAPTPTNAEINQACRGSTAGNIRYLLTRLEERRLIRVEWVMPHGRRIVIAATGNATRPSPSSGKARSAGHRAAGLAAVIPNEIDDATLPARVERDPCFHCGTRRDVGCHHHPKGE